MAKVSIIIEDGPMGTILLDIESDPPFPEVYQEGTTAQITGDRLMTLVQKFGSAIPSLQAVGRGH